MKTKLLIVGALLVSATSFGQGKGKGKSQTHPVPPAKEVRSTHGSSVNGVARETHDGKTVSAIASSKNKGNHYGYDKRDVRVKKVKPVKKHTPVQKRMRTNRPDVTRTHAPVRGTKQ